jgi:hypothetical protein
VIFDPESVKTAVLLEQLVGAAEHHASKVERVAQTKVGRKANVLSNFERYERIAGVYDLIDLPFEYGRYRKIRPLLFRGLSGRILEAGVGTGRNFPFYP